MNKVPTIKGSAQTRLLLYRLLSARLNDVEQKLLKANPPLWDQIIASLESMMDSDAQRKSDEIILTQAFSYTDRSTREGLQKQIERITGQSLWLGSLSLLDSFVKEHTSLLKSVKRQHLDKINLAIK